MSIEKLAESVADAGQALVTLGKRTRDIETNAVPAEVLRSVLEELRLLQVAVNQLVAAKHEALTAAGMITSHLDALSKVPSDADQQVYGLSEALGRVIKSVQEL